MFGGVTARVHAFVCPQSPLPPELHSAGVRAHRDSLRGCPGGPPHTARVLPGLQARNRSEGSHHLRPQEHVASPAGVCGHVLVPAQRLALCVLPAGARASGLFPRCPTGPVLQLPRDQELTL